MKHLVCSATSCVRCNDVTSSPVILHLFFLLPQVSEDASPNTVVHVVQAYDPDGDDVSYALAGGERLTDGPFRIDPDSGIITLTGMFIGNLR